MASPNESCPYAQPPCLIESLLSNRERLMTNRYRIDAEGEIRNITPPKARAESQRWVAREVAILGMAVGQWSFARAEGPRRSYRARSC